MVILGLPVAGFLIVKRLSDTHIRMPGHYIVERVDSSMRDGRMTYDTLYHRLEDFRFVNQLGQPVTRRDLEGKVVLLDFFFTSCPSICPLLTTHLKGIQDAFARSDSALRILSITVDPARDSVARLRAYADRYHVNHETWWFLTGDKERIFSMARGEFRLSTTAATTPDGLDAVHSGKLILLDKYQYIRGYYDGLDSAALRRCVADIAMLMLEKPPAP